MRHRRLRRKLGVKSKHRKALLRNIARGLVLNKRIRTTLMRAKEASAFIDGLVQIAKKGGLHARRRLIVETGSAPISKLLMEQIAPHFTSRQGGYTRVLRMAPRPGDGSPMAILEFTETIEVPEKKSKKTKKKAKKSEEAKKETQAKKKTQEPKEAKTDDSEKEKLDKKESEKKGGFLGALRKFLKGDE